MKKIISILFLFSLIFVFGGCSSFQNNSSDGDATFTFSQSIWKSGNEGASWEVKNSGIGKANTKKPEVLSFAINPLDKNNILAGLRNGGIMETNDGGESWRFINYQSEKVYGLVLDPRDGRTLYASGVWKGRGKIFKTQNDGVNWEEVYTSPTEGPLVISLTIDQKNPDVIYATTSEKEVIKSSDKGKSWRNIYLASTPILKVAIDASNSNLIYFIGNNGDIFRSINGGEVVEKIVPKIVGANLRGFKVIETSPTVGGRVYIAGSSGMIFSDDAGETWNKILALNNSTKFPITALAINPKNSKEMVYSMTGATYKSVDEGKTWKTSQFNNGMKLNILKYDPSGSGEIYAGFVKE